MEFRTYFYWLYFFFKASITADKGMINMTGRYNPLCFFSFENTIVTKLHLWIATFLVNISIWKQGISRECNCISQLINICILFHISKLRNVRIVQYTRPSDSRCLALRHLDSMSRSKTRDCVIVNLLTRFIWLNMA